VSIDGEALQGAGRNLRSPVREEGSAMERDGETARGRSGVAPRPRGAAVRRGGRRAGEAKGRPRAAILVDERERAAILAELAALLRRNPFLDG
jgi:hypothetical protein